MPTSKNRYALIPEVSLGSLKFGQRIDALVDEKILVEIETSYDFPDDERGEFRVYAYSDDPDGDDVRILPDEDGATIGTFCCRESIMVDGRELIGLSLQELRQELKMEADQIEEDFEVYDGDIQTIADFDGLGVQAWLRDDKVVTVCASVYED